MKHGGVLGGEGHSGPRAPAPAPQRWMALLPGVQFDCSLRVPLNPDPRDNKGVPETPGKAVFEAPEL